jgi:hypothetical protein
MLDLTKNFSTEVQNNVKSEKLEKIPGFPGNTDEFKFAFVTPKMNKLYKSRENKELPDFGVVDKRFYHIMECVGSELKAIENTDLVLAEWEKETGNKLN